MSGRRGSSGYPSDRPDAPVKDPPDSDEGSAKGKAEGRGVHQVIAPDPRKREQLLHIRKTDEMNTEALRKLRPKGSADVELGGNKSMEEVRILQAMNKKTKAQKMIEQESLKKKQELKERESIDAFKKTQREKAEQNEKIEKERQRIAKEKYDNDMKLARLKRFEGVDPQYVHDAGVRANKKCSRCTVRRWKGGGRLRERYIRGSKREGERERFAFIASHTQTGSSHAVSQRTRVDGV